MNIATMRRLEQLYKKISLPIEQLVFPIILLIWPLVKSAQGIDVTDSTYSLGNYLFADKLDSVWVLSTYLSNLFGALLVRLPGGATLLGANIYTGLIISATALMCYYALRKDFSAPVMFIGEFLAISFCWIPSSILYNYMTYLLFNGAALLLYYAIKFRKTALFYMAGLVLGLNSFVRIPNIAEVGLILVVWIALPIALRDVRSGDRKRSASAIGATGNCIVGYIIGMVIPVVLIDALYGVYSLNRLISGLSDMSASNGDYTLGAMILSVIKAYIRSGMWVFVILAVIFAGTLMMAVVKNNTILKWIGRVIYAAVLMLMLRFFWGRGMYSFRYYEDYTSMYEWGMLILILAWICVITVLIRRSYNPLVKTFAVIALVMLIITPIGSNNYTMQNINNMFLVIPFVLYIVGGWLYRGTHRLRLEGVMYGCNFPWMSMVLVILAMVFIQSTGFHLNFSFKDGMDGTPRSSVMVKSSATESLAGMHTTEYNAQTLTELCEYIDSDQDIDNVIYWGNCPGLAYILRKAPALSTAWPDLDSYPIADLEEELTQVNSDTIIIWKEYTEYSGNNSAIKEELVKQYIDENRFTPVFTNDEYTVYSK
ncbi:MAG: hypothetical protein K5868_02715 [Lachnospiraceae bacterium]|nr:hypothetical protein [Lachnospiraceae bacterium]